MAEREIKMKLLEMSDKNVMGFRTVGGEYFIGNVPVEIQNNKLLINNETYTLTSGLLSLLTRLRPKGYSTKDRNNYKEILLLTNVHRRHFNRNERIIASVSWKYKNIIAKLFPPKRTSLSKSSSNSKKQKLDIIPTVERSSEGGKEEYYNVLHYDGVNGLVEELKK